MRVSGQGAKMNRKSTVASPKGQMMLRPFSTRNWYQTAYPFSHRRFLLDRAEMLRVDPGRIRQ